MYEQTERGVLDLVQWCVVLALSHHVRVYLRNDCTMPRHCLRATCLFSKYLRYSVYAVRVKRGLMKYIFLFGFVKCVFV